MRLPGPTHAVTYQRDVFQPDRIFDGYSCHELIEVAYQVAGASGRGGRVDGTPVAPHVPGEKAVPIELYLVHQVLPIAGMFVAAMKQNDCALHPSFGEPCPVKQPAAIGQPKRALPRSPPRGTINDRTPPDVATGRRVHHGRCCHRNLLFPVHEFTE